MKKTNFHLIIIAFLLLGCKKPALIIDGSRDFQIVIPVQADLMEHKAAQQLQYYLWEMSNDRLSIVEEVEYTGDNAIYIGRTDYATSIDGENFSESLKVVNPYKRDEAYEVNERTFFEHSFEADMVNRKARYIKVHAENILHCPPWHLSSGSPAIIVSDAIVVN